MSPEAYVEMARTEDVHWWFVARRTILTRLLRSMSLKKDARILEVGSGTGGNLDMLSQFGTVSALEMDDTARAMAKEKTGGQIDIRAGKCPGEIPFEDQKFDLICMFDVLEHIEQDVETLDALKGLLAPEGRMIITVPAYQWMWSAHDEFLHHHRRYSARDFKSKVNSVDLHILRLSHFNFLLFPIAFLVRMKDRLTKNDVPTGGSPPPKLVNWLLTRVFKNEALLLSFMNLPAGLSLVSILRSE